jgi:hypothetical protein
LGWLIYLKEGLYIFPAMPCLFPLHNAPPASTGGGAVVCLGFPEPHCLEPLPHFKRQFFTAGKSISRYSPKSPAAYGEHMRQTEMAGYLETALIA